MSAVDGAGWFGDLYAMSWTYEGYKFWCIETDEIYIKMTPSNDPAIEWKLWAVNATQNPPTRVYDSLPFLVYPPPQEALPGK